MSATASENRHTTPGHRVIAQVGGVHAAAALAGGSSKSVYRWLQPVDKGGGGGLIPVPAQRRMVENAQARGLALGFGDFAPQAGEVIL